MTFKKYKRKIDFSIEQHFSKIMQLGLNISKAVNVFYFTFPLSV